MQSITLEDFVKTYIEAVSGTIQSNCLHDSNAFYGQISKLVSDKTGFSEQQITYLHHPFHWILFLRKNSPLKLSTKKRNNGMESDWEVKTSEENFPFENSELIARILNEYGTLLQQRLDCILKYQN